MGSFAKIWVGPAYVPHKIVEQMCQGGNGKDHWETIFGELSQHITWGGMVQNVGHEGVLPTTSLIVAWQIELHIQILASYKYEHFVGLQVH